MLVHLLTIHPAMCYGPLQESILGKAGKRGLLDARVVNIRDFAYSKHQITDDYPYGGGAGLVLKPEPIFASVEWCRSQGAEAGVHRAPRVLLMDPQGRRFDQTFAQELAEEEHLIFICGRYEGFDERVRTLVTDEVSMGDYVLTGGELPALTIIDAVSRLRPGVLGDETSAVTDSFIGGRLDWPQYTRPPEFQGMKVPEILLSGDHGRIDRWRRKEALRRTYLRRPDLLRDYPLSKEEKQWLKEIQAEESIGAGNQQ